MHGQVLLAPPATTNPLRRFVSEAVIATLIHTPARGDQHLLTPRVPLHEFLVIESPVIIVSQAADPP